MSLSSILSDFRGTDCKLTFYEEFKFRLRDFLESCCVRVVTKQPVETLWRGVFGGFLFLFTEPHYLCSLSSLYPAADQIVDSKGGKQKV